MWVALGWLWGRIEVALRWLWGAYPLAINRLWDGFDVALMSLWRVDIFTPQRLSDQGLVAK